VTGREPVLDCPPMMRPFSSLALTSLLILAGCGSAAQPAASAPASPSAAVSTKPAASPSASASSAAKPAASAQSSAAAGTKPLTKVIEALPTHDVGYLSSIVAREKGYFSDAGLQVDLPVMTSQVAIPALINKQVTFAAHGSAQRAAYQGAALTAIWYAWQYNTFYAVASKDIKTYQDLKGKVLAIASPGSSEDVIIHLLLKKEGISPDQVNIIAMGGGPQRVTAMIGGQVNFSVLNPDVTSELEEKGFTILGPLADVLPVPWSGFAVHKDTLRDQPDMIKGWLHAQEQALLFIKQNPTESAAIAMKEFELSQSVADKALKLLQPAISDDDPGGLTQAGLVLNTQVDMDALKLTGDPLALGEKVNDMGPLREVQRQMGIHCTKGFQC